MSGTHKENHKLKQYVQQLEDENNLLKLKFEILLDMVCAVILCDMSDWKTDKKINRCIVFVDLITETLHFIFFFWCTSYTKYCDG